MLKIMLCTRQKVAVDNGMLICISYYRKCRHSSRKNYDWGSDLMRSLWAYFSSARERHLAVLGGLGSLVHKQSLLSSAQPSGKKKRNYKDG
jgi:hypothetical protein